MQMDVLQTAITSVNVEQEENPRRVNFFLQKLSINAMTSISVADDGGDEMMLFRYNGYNYPNFPTHNIKHMPRVKIRSDDVIINAYPKSGTHWVNEITRLLLAGKLDRDVKGKGIRMIEKVSEEDYKNLPSPRLLNTHVLFRHLPEEVKVKKPRLVYITRNPKDVVVSFYNFMKKKPITKYSGEWKNYLRPVLEGRFEYGSWFDYTKEWEEVKKTTDIPILTLNYEDLKEDTAREIWKLCHFLGIERTDEFVKELCDHTEFASLKNFKEGSDIVYRKGEVGEWKNWFTVAQNEWFDQLYQEKMKDCPLRFRYTLD